MSGGWKDVFGIHPSCCGGLTYGGLVAEGLFAGGLLVDSSGLLIRSASLVGCGVAVGDGFGSRHGR